MKIALYTCITNSYDQIHAPAHWNDGIDYFLFTDTDCQPLPPWRVIKVNIEGLGPKDLNRYIKMHPHAIEELHGYDLTIYTDGSIQQVGILDPLINGIMARRENIFFFEHPQRDCIYDEAVANAHFAHGWFFSIAKQMRRYRKNGFPAKRGLYEGSIIFCKRSKEAEIFMEAWWKEYWSGVKRDQLSLTYVSWRLAIPLGSLGVGDIHSDRKYFHFNRHPRKFRLDAFCRRVVNRAFARIIPYKMLY